MARKLSVKKENIFKFEDSIFSTPDHMTASETGKNLIKFFEGFREKSYLCSAGVWTIGYGTTYINNSTVTSGMTITKEQAEKYFDYSIEDCEKTVNEYVKVKINQNQFDALVSFVYNFGAGNFRTSTLLRLLNEGKYDLAALQFLRWNKEKNKNGTYVVNKGLTARREAEKKLFTSIE